jgi:heat shock transcription factor
MNRPIATRKRSTPGASPLAQQQTYNNVSYTAVPEQNTNNNAGLADWGSTNGIGDLNNGLFNDASIDNGTYDTSLNGSAGFSGAAGLTDGQLVRRTPNQQLVSRNPSNWQDAGGGAGDFSTFEQVDEDDLEQKAMAAKREAQSKRKQIPPFVQKLSRLAGQFMHCRI